MYMARTESDRASVLTDARRPPGTLDRDAAMVLVRRGVKPADALEEGLAGGGGRKYVWASDPALLMPPRVRVDEKACLNILENILCPSVESFACVCAGQQDQGHGHRERKPLTRTRALQVVVFAEDGMWRRAAFLRTRIFSRPWALVFPPRAPPPPTHKIKMHLLVPLGPGI